MLSDHCQCGGSAVPSSSGLSLSSASPVTIKPATPRSLNRRMISRKLRSGQHLPSLPLPGWTTTNFRFRPESTGAALIGKQAQSSKGISGPLSWPKKAAVWSNKNLLKGTREERSATIKCDSFMPRDRSFASRCALPFSCTHPKARENPPQPVRQASVGSRPFLE